MIRKLKIHPESSPAWVNCILIINKVNIKQFKEIFAVGTQKPTRGSNSGFSLIESLLSLSFFLIILVASLEFFVSTRNHFIDLRDEQEINLAGYAALDKIRLDLCVCGLGLVTAQSAGLLEAIDVIDNILTIQGKDKDVPLGNDLVTGQTFIPLVSTSGIKKGQKMCFIGPEGGEVKTITRVSKQGLSFSSPLESSYKAEETTAILIRTITFYLEGDRGILRRKVNTNPAQPLLEEVTGFDVFYETTTNIISLNLKLRTKEEKKYETSIFLKNVALVPTQ
jgi:hypothetical protein